MRWAPRILAGRPRKRLTLLLQLHVWMNCQAVVPHAGSLGVIWLHRTPTVPQPGETWPFTPVSCEMHLYSLLSVKTNVSLHLARAMFVMVGLHVPPPPPQTLAV